MNPLLAITSGLAVLNGRLKHISFEAELIEHVFFVLIPHVNPQDGLVLVGSQETILLTGLADKAENLGHSILKKRWGLEPEGKVLLVLAKVSVMHVIAVVGKPSMTKFTLLTLGHEKLEEPLEVAISGGIPITDSIKS